MNDNAKLVEEIDRVIEAVEKTRCTLGLSTGKLAAAGRALMTHWPAIRAALSQSLGENHDADAAKRAAEPRTELAALIERLEKATGHDRQLNADIAFAMGLYSRPPEVATPPDYTASIDAALMLVPEGHYWGLFDEPNAWVWPTPHRDLLTGIQAKGATPAIALCIAALKARAAEAVRPAKLTPQQEHRGSPEGPVRQ